MMHQENIASVRQPLAALSFANHENGLALLQSYSVATASWNNCEVALEVLLRNSKGSIRV